jgi:peptidyl-tRNA hydrolase, PTH1 family
VGLRLVVGLGNPGQQYERTRHNVGFAAVDRLAADAEWKTADLGLWTKVGDLFLAKPTTYMNESGQFVKPFASYRNITPAEILVVYDEIALPLGRLRIRPNGSAGGHNGMKSLIAHLGTDRFPRLRIGVGPQPAGVDSAQWVLGKFAPAERKTLEDVLDQAAAAARELETENLDAVMNRYNPKA